MGDSEMTSDLIDEGKELIRRGIWIFIIMYILYIYVYACLTCVSVSFTEKRKRQRIEDGENRRRVSAKHQQESYLCCQHIFNRENWNKCERTEAKTVL